LVSTYHIQLQAFYYFFQPTRQNNIVAAQILAPFFIRLYRSLISSS